MSDLLYKELSYWLNDPSPQQPEEESSQPSSSRNDSQGSEPISILPFNLTCHVVSSAQCRCRWCEGPSASQVVQASNVEEEPHSTGPSSTTQESDASIPAVSDSVSFNGISDDKIPMDVVDEVNDGAEPATPDREMIPSRDESQESAERRSVRSWTCPGADAPPLAAPQPTRNRTQSTKVAPTVAVSREREQQRSRSRSRRRRLRETGDGIRRGIRRGVRDAMAAIGRRQL